MKTFANIFLILFLNVAGLGIADALFSQKLGLTSLATLHNFANGLAVCFGLALYLGFAFNKQLPKSVLVPPIIFLFWGMLAYWPMENFTGENYRLVAAAVQLLLGLLVLQQNRKLNQTSRLMMDSQFAGPGFCGRNLLRFFLFNIPLLPLIVLLLGFSAVSSLIDEQTAGFMRLKPNGLYMVEKTYQQNDKNIQLSSMIHLGQSEYYGDLSRSLQGQQALILAEGVSDNSGRLQGEFSYQKIADLLGLASQEQTLFDGRRVSTDSLDQLDDRQPNTTDILPADIDLIEFDEQTIAMLNALGKYVLTSDSLADGFAEFNQWTAENTNVETNQIVINDLLQKRNRSVLSYLPKALQKYDTLIIPWGALHMPGLETAILHKGFAMQKQQERLSVDFLLLPYGRLFGE